MADPRLDALRQIVFQTKEMDPQPAEANPPAWSSDRLPPGAIKAPAPDQRELMRQWLMARLPQGTQDQIRNGALPAPWALIRISERLTNTNNTRMIALVNFASVTKGSHSAITVISATTIQILCTGVSVRGWIRAKNGGSKLRRAIPYSIRLAFTCAICILPAPAPRGYKAPSWPCIAWPLRAAFRRCNIRTPAGSAPRRRHRGGGACAKPTAVHTQPTAPSEKSEVQTNCHMCIHTTAHIHKYMCLYIRGKYICIHICGRQMSWNARS